jgi:PAS domain-containing protein
LLIATGLFGVQIEPSVNTVLDWLCRVAQYLGGIYMLVAAIMAVRESGVWELSLEKALRESEERFRVAQKLSPGGFSILRPVRDCQGRVVDFTWVYANPGTERMAGMNLPALAGRSLLELFPGHRGSPLLEAYQQVAETGTMSVREGMYQGDGILAQHWFCKGYS